MTLHHPMTEQQRQHLAHKARQARFAAAALPQKGQATQQTQLRAVEEELNTVREALRDANSIIHGLILDKSDLQAIVLAQAARLCQSRRISDDAAPAGKRRVREIIAAMLEDYPNISVDEVTGLGRSKYLVEVRHRCMAAVYVERTELSLPKIAEFFDRDHTTVIHAIKKLGVWRARGGADESNSEE